MPHTYNCNSKCNPFPMHIVSMLSLAYWYSFCDASAALKLSCVSDCPLSHLCVMIVHGYARVDELMPMYLYFFLRLNHLTSIFLCLLQHSRCFLSFPVARVLVICLSFHSITLRMASLIHRSIPNLLIRIVW